MGTTIINPASNVRASRTNGVGFLIGGVVLFLLAVLFLIYIFPSIQRGFNMGEANINIPEDFNVNIKQVK